MPASESPVSKSTLPILDDPNRPGVNWYFDFVSPFAYLQHELLLRHQQKLQLIYRPVLFAGLLKHWESKGPAEIPAKRSVVYQYCQWFADNHEITMKFPPAHPFNPLRALRLAIGLGCGQKSVTAIYRAIFANGKDLSRQQDWEELCQQLKVTDGSGLIDQQWVKDQLRSNTEQAAQQGLFGVPTLLIGDQQFWGMDMTDMALEYLENPDWLSQGEHCRLASLPVGQARKV